MSANSTRGPSDYERVAQAILFLEDHAGEQPDVAAVAANAGLSPYHFQRLFRRWAGTSPKRFLQCLTVAQAKCALADSRSVLDAAFEVGLSGPGRLHDLFVACEAMTPGEYKQRGQGLDIHYGYHETRFSDCLLLVTTRGICGLAFTEHSGRDGALADIRRRWPHPRYTEDASLTAPLARRIFAPITGEEGAPISLFLRGTNFQIKVWQALLTIPPGCLASYEWIAGAIGQPGAARAVGSAIAANPISYLVPCHRAIRKSGVIGDYAWGRTRKKAMLGWEAAHCGTAGAAERVAAA
jgi:AraC family transcriptional regulator of adaptative response/methylated-DNA-[protein]-cysteine methyltransferase